MVPSILSTMGDSPGRQNNSRNCLRTLIKGTPLGELFLWREEGGREGGMREEWGREGGEGGKREGWGHKHPGSYSHK